MSAPRSAVGEPDARRPVPPVMPDGTPRP